MKTRDFTWTVIAAVFPVMVCVGWSLHPDKPWPVIIGAALGTAVAAVLNWFGFWDIVE